MNEQEEKMFGEEFDRWIDNADEQRKNGGYDCMVKTVNSILQDRSKIISQEKEKWIQDIRNCMYEHNPARHGDLPDDAYIRVLDMLQK